MSQNVQEELHSKHYVYVFVVSGFGACYMCIYTYNILRGTHAYGTALMCTTATQSEGDTAMHCAVTYYICPLHAPASIVVCRVSIPIVCGVCVHACR